MSKCYNSNCTVESARECWHCGTALCGSHAVPLWQDASNPQGILVNGLLCVPCDDKRIAKGKAVIAEQYRVERERRLSEQRREEQRKSRRPQQAPRHTGRR